MKIQDAVLVDLLQQAYSAEKAAAFAYQGHAGSVRSLEEKKAIREIEEDEWHHRRTVLDLMREYDVPVSKYYEVRFHLIGKIISASCYVIGWFMPFYFAGRLESGNVCEYFRMKHRFNSLGITKHDEILYEMGLKEKMHEVYFAESIKGHKLLPFFEWLFSWSAEQSFNDVDVSRKLPAEKSNQYCASTTSTQA